MMRAIASVSTCVAICLSLSTLPALAADPPAQPAPSAQAVPATPQPSSAAKAPSQSAATTPAAAASAHPSKSHPELTEAEKNLISSGYRLEMHGGEKIFCRREAELGSHFERKVCGTPESLATARQVSRDMTERAQRNGTNPTGN